MGNEPPSAGGLPGLGDPPTHHVVHVLGSTKVHHVVHRATRHCRGALSVRSPPVSSRTPGRHVTRSMGCPGSGSRSPEGRFETGARFVCPSLAG